MESEDQRKVGDGENNLFSPPHLPRAWGVWDPQREPVWGCSDHRGPFPILSPFPCLPRSHSRARCVTHAHAHTHTPCSIPPLGLCTCAPSCLQCCFPGAAGRCSTITVPSLKSSQTEQAEFNAFSTMFL